MGFSEEINAEVAQNIDWLVWIDQFLKCFIEIFLKAIVLRWIMLSINYATNGVVFPEFWISIHNAWNASFDAFPITVYLKLWMIKQLSLEPEWAIVSEAMRARGITVLVKSNQLVKKISRLNIFRKWKLDINPFLPPKHYKHGGRFSLLVGCLLYTSPSPRDA